MAYKMIIKLTEDNIADGNIVITVDTKGQAIAIKNGLDGATVEKIELTKNVEL